MFNFKKAKEKARKLYHMCWFLKDYTKYVCSDFPTEEDERYSIVIDYLGKLSDELYSEFIERSTAD